MQAHVQPPYVLGRPGQVVAGRFQLVAPLGQGAMGEVWRAMHLTLGIPIAIKLVAARAGDDEAVVRFSREARAAAALKSRHVVGVHDYGSEGPLLYLAMELLEGETLQERLGRLGRLAPADAAKIIQEVARGVGRAHQLGVVHRDLKPANVFIARSDDGEVAKILDFGIAKLASTAGGFQTRSGESMGTPAYMSPEQVMGSDVDTRSDLWQVAIIAFECLTGKLPYAASTTGELLSQIATRRLVTPSHLAPHLSHAVDEWFLKATALDRNKRYPTAEALAEGMSRAIVAPPPTATMLAPAAEPKQRTQMLLGVLLGVGALALGLLVFVAIAVTRSTKPHDGEAPAASSAATATTASVASIPIASAPPRASTPSADPEPSSSAAPAASASAPPAPSASAKPRPRSDPWGF